MRPPFGCPTFGSTTMMVVKKNTRSKEDFVTIYVD